MFEHILRRMLPTVLVATGAMLVGAGPADNLSSDYQNPVNAKAWTNQSGRVAVQMVGNGYYFTTNKTFSAGGYSYGVRNTFAQLSSLIFGTWRNPIVQTTIGVPISASPANVFLGEALTPPEDWNGAEPNIVENTGGKAVWIDFAEQVVAIEAGPIQVEWPTAGGGVHVENSVVSASPNKRPVRLYWTHERPEYASDTSYRALQNAGPTVSFGQNYKVHIYPTSKVGIFNPNDYNCHYEKDDGKGYIRLNGTDLEAFAGTYGTFLIAYSRLDETLNQKKLLAYEIVEVMEPSQTQIDVKIGDQLKPQTRSYATEELFPRVTRGLIDESENDEIYVYQHSTGSQKNYIWAIRDSSENPWKIEVFWRAKEELDVIWPFECDIYAASWDRTGAQFYARDTEEAVGGKAKTEPVVYYPSGVNIEAMDYQVAYDEKTGKTAEKKHMHISDGVLYSDWADESTFSLLKYTSGDSVWFQTVRSIPAKNTALLESLSLDYAGVCTNLAYRTGTFPEGKVDLAFSTNVALAAEIRAPFAAEDGFFYPGWIRRDREVSEDSYPVRNPYNPEVYDYPSSYVATNDLYAPIFPVNLGELEIWWSLPSSLMGQPRTDGGNGEALSANIYFPALPFTYSIHTPEQIGRLEGKNEFPQIVIASGKGSAGYSLCDHLYGDWGEVSSALQYLGPANGTVDSLKAIEVKLAGMNNTEGVVSNFTFETRLRYINYSDAMDLDTAWAELPLLSVYGREEDGTRSETPRFTLGTSWGGHFYLNGVDVTSDWNRSYFRDDIAEFVSFDGDASDQSHGMHLVFMYEDGKWKFYVNGHLAHVQNDPGRHLDIANDYATLFDTKGGMNYFGPIHHVRLWSGVRSEQEIYENRYLACGAASKLVFQYYGPTQEFENEGDAETINGVVKNGFIADSSGHDARAYPIYGPEVMGQSTAKWLTAGTLTDCTLRLPHLGQTFPADAKIYRQNNRELDGYNPNEEHGLLIGGVAHAMRCDLNKMNKNAEGDDKFTSLPYVLVQYNDADTHKVKMCALRVVPENDMYRFRRYLDAGSMIQSPDPIARFQPANLQKFVSGPLYGDTETCFADRKGYYWAHQAGDDGNATNYVFEISYPNQNGFDFTDGQVHPAGEITPWLANYEYRDDWYVWTLVDEFAEGEFRFPLRPEDDVLGSAIDYTYIVNWPKNVPGLYVNDTLHGAKNGLPAVRGQLSAKIVYQQSAVVTTNDSVVLIDPETRRGGSLKEIPDDVRVYRDPKTSKRHFTDLPPFLRDRFVWNPNAFYDLTHNDTRELELTGKYIADANYQFAYLNVMDSRSKAVMLDPELMTGSADQKWIDGINSVDTEPLVLTDDVTPFTEMALATTGKGSGYVTLVFNDSTNLDMVPKSEVITMYVIKVVPELYNGYLHVIQSDNPLDKQLNMKYTSDFGGKPENWEFEWEYCEPVAGKAAESDDASAWFTLAGSCGKDGIPMLDWITVGDAGVFGLSDHYVRCRYRSLDPEVIATVGNEWSNWCTPKLAEGWIKRVLKAINPFDQRIRDFLNNKVDTQLTMIQQAGTPYQGDIPLNLEALSENGLIAIYETVLNQAKKLSIDADYTATESLALALQMAAGRIAELYTVLGNEAYADALNPTVDLGANSGIDDTAESSIFPFMNQCENVLDEELALLRGRDMSDEYRRSWKDSIEPWEFPCYNRLAWNFTADVMGGQVAYVENYGIRDVCGASDADDPSAEDGIIDVYDAKNLYPQGHGDAWGHYLSALKGYYALLRHPNFGWKPQIEGILAGQNTITIGYLHEKRFAQAAELKAKVGEKIVADTYRQNYIAGEKDSWLEAEDTTTWTDGDGRECRRAWGTDEWATRAHLGAYYDWAVANALLPARNAEQGQIRMLDRESTKEISGIAASARRIQATADYADTGMNPLGLSDNAIPFDISPSEIDAGKTHFEQIYDRAVKATKVAKDVFNRVKGISGRLRDQNASSDFEHMVDDEESAIERRLIEIYGYPYDDDIGPGKTYEQGYAGPDIYHYYYVETYDLDGSGGINGEYRGVQTGDGSYGRYIDVTVDDYQLITTNITGTFQAEIDESLADNGFLGNMIVGAVSWYQNELKTVGSYIDPFSKYTGICATNFALPVAVVDTTGDALDGKVDYTFSIAAWSNTPWVASYFVGENGFTPKPKEFHGQRKAEGETQIALNGYAIQLAEIDVKANKLFAANEKLQGLIDELTTLDHDTQMGYVTDAAKKEVENYTAACKKNAETVKTTLSKLKEFKDTLTESGVEAFPKLTGLSFDLTSVGRAALLAVKSGVNDLMNGQLAEQIDKIGKCESAIEELEDQLTQQFTAWMSNADRQKKVAAIKEQTAVVKSCLAELEVAYNAANETRMKYAKIVAEGDELQAERERLRIQWSADLSQDRYRNMMYQILRNDELARYNEAFELAAKYTFLAAKAYDYETGLLQSDSANAAGCEFMTSIIKARSLGRFSPDGQPLGGGSEGEPGLADILFRMGENWSVLKGRLGFNNPQGDIDSFSLRQDLFGKLPTSAGDAAWRQKLAECWVDNIKTHPAFSQLCQPFDPMLAAEPGFVIPFHTEIAARKDLFGNDLAGGSTAYSTTYFATKLRGVGVWIEGDGTSAGIPKRPEVYLVPAGLDYLRAPVKASGSAAKTRCWQVVDQVLPIPYALADSDWESSDWSALKDIYQNELCVTRRHPAIRANVGTVFDESSTMTYNSRLIGRSVWNDQWYIIIPAASLNSDNDEAKARFLDKVRDIHLNLKTYSFSGN